MLCLLPINKVDRYTIDTINSLSKQSKITPTLYIIGFSLREKDIRSIKTVLKKTKIKYKLILLDKDLGPVEGYNIGFSEAMNDNIDFSYILKMDDDIRFTKENTIWNLINIINKYSEEVIVAPIIYNPERSERLYGFKIGYIPISKPESAEGCVEVDLHIGTVLLFKKETFLKVGLFKGYYFIIGDPSDWMLRARKKGIKCILSLKDEIIHPTRPKTSVSSKRVYFIVRNRIFLYRENFGTMWPFHFVITFINQFFKNTRKTNFKRKIKNKTYRKKYLNRNAIVFAVKGFIDGIIYSAEHSPIKYDFKELYNKYNKTKIVFTKNTKLLGETNNE